MIPPCQCEKCCAERERRLLFDLFAVPLMAALLGFAIGGLVALLMWGFGL